MKIKNSNVSLSKICFILKVTRQSYYQNFDRSLDLEFEHELVIQEVIKVRQRHPRMGTRKLYILLENFMNCHYIKMGRDALFDLLSEHNLLIRKRKKYTKTTQSHHWFKKHSFLAKDFTPNAPNQLYVSDITYWKTNNEHIYISLITDVYSHKIVGYGLSKSLEADLCVNALQMALLNLKSTSNLNLMHHSDRGMQYCSFKYVKLLEDFKIKISMTQDGNPLDNSIAERVNGILKNEYLKCYEVLNFKDAEKLLKEKIELYNTERPHMSIGNIVPELVHNNKIPRQESTWKKYKHKQKQTKS